MAIKEKPEVFLKPEKKQQYFGSQLGPIEMTRNGLSSEAVQSKPVKKIKVKSVEEESPEIRYFISKARIRVLR